MADAELVIGLMMFGAVAISTYMAFKLDEQHAFIKTLLLFLSYFSILGIFQVGILTAEHVAGVDQSLYNLLVGMMWTYGIVGVIMVAYMGYYLMYGAAQLVKDKTKTMMNMK